MIKNMKDVNHVKVVSLSYIMGCMFDGTIHIYLPSQFQKLNLVCLMGLLLR